MDKTVLKNFAIESRKDLMEKIDRKIKLFYVDEEFSKDNRGDVIVLSNDKHTLTLSKEEDSNRDKLIKRIVELGYERVVEEAAYTWFNRIIAIRYMEIHNYLPQDFDDHSLGIRVLSSNDNKPIPEIMKYTNLSNPNLNIGFNKDLYSTFTKEDDKFKYILLLFCKRLGEIIPQVFDGITDYIDLLIPDNMLSENGFISKLLLNLSENDFKEVEVIGWLYQYYNQTEKDRVMSSRNNYKKHEIPYATELFTPDWIVKYMVENTLGRYSLEKISNEIESDKWKYLIKESIENNKEKGTIENIKFIDPCCGSGHILVYAFEVLYLIYLELGYSKEVIVNNILKNNLYGLDIDDRAVQLSILAIILKACEFDKNVFKNNSVKNLNIFSIQETNNINIDLQFIENEIIRNKISTLLNNYKDAKAIGSLINPVDDSYEDVIKYLSEENNIFSIIILNSIKPLIEQNRVLRSTYQIAVTNPPYMGSGKMEASLKKYLDKYYKNSKGDLCTTFMENRIFKDCTYFGMINEHAWMFTNSFEKLRTEFIKNRKISNMLHLGMGTFGADFGTTTFVSEQKNDKKSYFYRLVDYRSSEDKQKKFLELIGKDYYEVDDELFDEIPGHSIAYWADESLMSNYKKDDVKYLSDFCSGFSAGNKTADNNKYLRFHWEINNKKIGEKWFLYAKGGDWRKWYGNNEYVIDYSDSAKKYYNSNSSSCMVNEKYMFKMGFTYTDLTPRTFNCRLLNDNMLYDMAGPGVIPNTEFLYYCMGLFNSKVANEYFKILNSTFHYKLNNILRIPILVDNTNKKIVEEKVLNNIELMKKDWNSFEISPEFKKHPLVRGKGYIKDFFSAWEKECIERYNNLKSNEETINQIFIDLYGLKNIDKEVDEKENSIRYAVKEREIKSLISYAVGCMFGRYSLDEEGLIFAGDNFDTNKYKTYKPDDDNIIPISDNENVYYNDDIVGKFKIFIKNAYGIEFFNENIDYIADTLGKRGTESSEETIRRYFINDFYNDHVKIYQKRPIYWLFDSGKKNGFKCLIYLHRYNDQIVSKIRTKYLHNTLAIYQRIVEEIDYKLNNESLNITDKRDIQNKKIDINGKITECNHYEEMVGNVANKMIKLDLDDGVVVNYAKFVDDNGKSILAKIK